MRIIFPFEMRAMNCPVKADGVRRKWHVRVATWDYPIKTDLLSASYRMEEYLNFRHPLTVLS